jgi:hypothetical protein
MKNYEDFTEKDFKENIDCIIFYNDEDELDFSFSKKLQKFSIILNGKAIKTSESFKVIKDKLNNILVEYYLLNYNVFKT